MNAARDALAPFCVLVVDATLSGIGGSMRSRHWYARNPPVRGRCAIAFGGSIHPTFRILETPMKLAIPSAIAIATALVAPAHSANDGKMFSPGDCQPYGQSSTYDTLAIRADGVQNKTTNTNKYTICPIMHDSESDWTETEGLSTTLVFNYGGNGTIQCTRTIGTDVAGVLPMSTETITATQLGPYPTLKTISFIEAAGTHEQPATVTCRLPPLAKLVYVRSNEESVGP